MTFHPSRNRSTLIVGGIAGAIALAACGATNNPAETAAQSSTPSGGAGSAGGASQQTRTAVATSGADGAASNGRTVIASYDTGNRQFRVIGQPSEQGYCMDVRGGNSGKQQCDPVPNGPPQLQLRTFRQDGGEGYLVGIIDNPDIADVDLIANDGSPVTEDAEQFQLVDILDGRARAFAPVRGPIYYQAVVAKDSNGTTVAHQQLGDSGKKYTAGDKSGEGSATPGEPTTLTDVTLSRGNGTSTVRLEFAQDTVPHYEIGYQPRPLRYEGSGKPAELEGGQALAIDLTNAVNGGIEAGDLLLEPERQSHIAQSKSLGAFEGHVKLGIGVVGNAKTPFRVNAEGNSIVIQFDYGPAENT